MPRILRVAALLSCLAAVTAAADGCEPAVNTAGGLCDDNVQPACPFPSCPLLDGERICAAELGAGATCDEEDPADGVCKPGLFCGEGGVCEGAGLRERCGDNGAACMKGGTCKLPPGEKGGQPPSVCYEVVGVGELCELGISFANAEGFRRTCGEGLDWYAGGGC